MESSSQSSAYLMHSGNNSMDQTPRETLPIQPDRINKVCMPTQKIYTLSEQAGLKLIPSGS